MRFAQEVTIGTHLGARGNAPVSDNQINMVNGQFADQCVKVTFPELKFNLRIVAHGIGKEVISQYLGNRICDPYSELLLSGFMVVANDLGK